MREYLSDKQVKSELTALLQVVHEFLVEHNIKYTRCCDRRKVWKLYMNTY